MPCTRTVAISQARMTSTRLPGKVMMDLGGRPMLAYHLERLARARKVDAICVAVPEGPQSDPIRRLCDDLGVIWVDGPEQDVLARFDNAATVMSADVVVRVTSDCPFIDPVLIDLTVQAFHDQALNYATLDAPGSYPRGLDVEVFSRAALSQAVLEATEPVEREHVTAFFYRRPDRFRQARIGQGPGDRYRLCVDTSADLDLARAVANAFDGRADVSLESLLDWLQTHPDIALRNQSVRQKAD